MRSRSKALATVAKYAIDVALMDLVVPGIDGVKTAYLPGSRLHGQTRKCICTGFKRIADKQPIHLLYSGRKRV